MQKNNKPNIPKKQIKKKKKDGRETGEFCYMIPDK